LFRCFGTENNNQSVAALNSRRYGFLYENMVVSY
jgi:hypothetical protein